jgi:glycosyltransferase involved in cell wall biosynthesis
MPSDLFHVILVIPSYCPPSTFPSFIEELRGQGFRRLLIINDGSGPKYSAIFKAIEEKGHQVIHLPQNAGKGNSLKKAFEHIYLNEKSHDYVLTCDDDGQHHPEDVLKLARATRGGAKVYLGARTFDGDVPWKSLVGNLFMRMVFFLKTGKKLHDTQTGLRCFHRTLLPQLLNCKKGGFAYESKNLMDLINNGEIVVEIPIRTIYFDRNRSSRFHSLDDSIKIVFSLFSK